MIVFLVIALILIVVVFGVSSGMQSYASAQQAEATIQTAKATQMAVFGNVVVIIVVAAFLLALLILVLYAIKQKPVQPQVRPMRLPQLPINQYAKRLPIAYPTMHGELDHEVKFIELNPEQLSELEEELWALIDDEEQL